jgi:hypothetical protein
MGQTAIWRIAAIIAASVLIPETGGAQAVGDTTFLSGDALALKLIHNLVHISAPIDAGQKQQGFGMIVGSAAQDVYILAPDHVVRAGKELQVRFCAAGSESQVVAHLVPNFKPDGLDVALLRAPKPSGYTPVWRVLASEEHVKAREDVWVSGFDGRCEVFPTKGSIQTPTDAHATIRADLPGIRGGSSGGPLIVGYGWVGMVVDTNQLIVYVIALDRIADRVRNAGAPWQLEAARNIPPTDPLAAQMDLAEMLNRYLFAVRNAHGLLLQTRVARVTFAEYVDRYNQAIRRFSDTREKYDGTLAKFWPTDTLQEWMRLRETLWAVHLNFWSVNNDATEIARLQQVPPRVVQRMNALEPDLQRMEERMGLFLRSLAEGRKRDDTTKP